jgi:magnesium-transporting ATPase (P-type)
VTFEADGTVRTSATRRKRRSSLRRTSGDTKETLGAAFPRLAELPFDSDRKRMSVVVEHDGRKLAIVKGAFDGIAPLCTAAIRSARGRSTTR